jgi:DNA-binding NarL/FixJ family response regulator
MVGLRSGRRGPDCRMVCLSEERTTLLHVEPDVLWAAMVVRIVRHLPLFQHTGTARTGSDALTRCREQPVGVVIMETWLPDADGLALVDLFTELPRPPAILLLSARCDEVTLFRAFGGAVAGLLWKGSSSAQRLGGALNAVAAGRRYFPPEAVAAYTRFRQSPSAFFKILSDAEVKLMPLFANAWSDRRIAEETGSSANTIHAHRTRVLAKLDLHCSSDLTEWALAKGFGVRLRPMPPEVNALG